jgi:hypothetical protein
VSGLNDDSASRRLFLTPRADRFFLVPPARELDAGALEVVTLTGEEHRIEPDKLADLEVSRADAEAHVRAQAEQAIAGTVDAVGRALGLTGTGTGSSDLAALARRLGVSERELEGGSGAALGELVADLQAVGRAVASGGSADLDAARAKLKDRGIEVGAELDELPQYLAAIRSLDQASAAKAAATGLRAFADAIEGEPASLGRRIDELIERLERELGPYMGRDPERARREREARYESSARSAIAASLREHGITPLASTDDDR